MPTDLCASSELLPGTIRKAEHNGVAVAVCDVNGVAYVIADRCPHRGGSLSLGRLQGETIVCPWHGSAFALATGKPVVWVAKPRLLHWFAKLIPPFMRKAKTFQARVHEGRVIID